MNERERYEERKRVKENVCICKSHNQLLNIITAESARGKLNVNIERESIGKIKMKKKETIITKASTQTSNARVMKLIATEKPW